MAKTYYQAVAKAGNGYYWTCGHKHRGLDRAYYCQEKLQNAHENLTIIVVDEEGNLISYEP